MLSHRIVVNIQIKIQIKHLACLVRSKWEVNYSRSYFQISSASNIDGSMSFCQGATEKAEQSGGHFQHLSLNSENRDWVCH